MTYKGRTTTHYGFEASYEDPSSGRAYPMSDETTAAAYFAVRAGDAIPFRIQIGDPTCYQVGPLAGASVGAASFSLMAMGFLALLTFVIRSQRRAWYEQRKLVETARGPLTMS